MLYSRAMRVTPTSGDLKDSSCGQVSAKQLWWALAFFGSLAVATIGIRHVPFPSPVRYLVPAVPLVAGLMYVLTMVRDLRSHVDELHLRIYLEAAAVVVGGLFIIILTYPALQEAGILPALDYSIVLALILALGAGGYANARRRYR